jgi:hypothetical protein
MPHHLDIDEDLARRLFGMLPPGPLPNPVRVDPMAVEIARFRRRAQRAAVLRRIIGPAGKRP